MASPAPTSEDWVQPGPSSLRLWFGLLGAPIAWAVHFLIMYGLTEAGCVTGLQRSAILGLDSLSALTFAVTLVTVGVMVAAGLVARQAWQEERAVEHSGDGEPTGRTAYMGFAGMLLSGLFLLVIIQESLPFFVLNPCVAM